MDPLLAMISTYISSIYPLLNITNKGVDKAPIDHVTWGATGSCEPPNLRDTEIRCG